MTKREKRIAAAMVFLMAVWGITSLIPKSQNRKKGAKKVSKDYEHDAVMVKDSRKEGQLDFKNMTEQIQLSSERTEIKEKVNPFLKPAPKAIVKSSTVGFSDLVLSGIILEEDETPVALINEEILREGDEFAGFRVEAIRDNEVLLIKGLERYILKLFREKEETGGE